MGLCHLDKIWLSKIWVVLDLQGGDRVLGISEHVVKRLGLKVRDTNRFGNALIYSSFEGLPGLTIGDVSCLDGFPVF